MTDDFVHKQMEDEDRVVKFEDEQSSKIKQIHDSEWEIYTGLKTRPKPDERYIEPNVQRIRNRLEIPALQVKLTSGMQQSASRGGKLDDNTQDYRG